MGVVTELSIDDEIPAFSIVFTGGSSPFAALALGRRPFDNTELSKLVT